MIPYEKILLEYLERDPRAIVMTAENRAPLRNIADRLGSRFIDTGITEQTMVGMAAGLALRGRRPVVHALAAFLTMRAFEFIRTDVGIAALPVKLVGFVPGVLSDANGPTHQAIEDVALMRGIPGMRVFCPSDEEDLVQCLPRILDSDWPCYIRYTTAKAQITHLEGFEPGKAEVFSVGKDVTILAYGALVGEASRAAEELRRDGLDVGIVNMRMLNPVDEEVILQATQQSTWLVTVEDHFVTGGLATIVAEVLLRHRRTTRHIPIAFESRWFKPALLPRVLEHEGLTGPAIATKIRSRVKEIAHA